MRTTLDTRNLQQDVLFMLVDHFNYSVKDINSYDELTDEEKRIISEDTWNRIINNKVIIWGPDDFNTLGLTS